MHSVVTMSLRAKSYIQKIRTKSEFSVNQTYALLMSRKRNDCSVLDIFKEDYSFRIAVSSCLLFIVSFILYCLYVLNVFSLAFNFKHGADSLQHIVGCGALNWQICSFYILSNPFIGFCALPLQIFVEIIKRSGRELFQTNETSIFFFFFFSVWFVLGVVTVYFTKSQEVWTLWSLYRNHDI